MKDFLGKGFASISQPGEKVTIFSPLGGRPPNVFFLNAKQLVILDEIPTFLFYLEKRARLRTLFVFKKRHELIITIQVSGNGIFVPSNGTLLIRKLKLLDISQVV